MDDMMVRKSLKFIIAMSDGFVYLIANIILAPILWLK